MTTAEVVSSHGGDELFVQRMPVARGYFGTDHLLTAGAEFQAVFEMQQPADIRRGAVSRQSRQHRRMQSDAALSVRMTELSVSNIRIKRRGAGFAIKGNI